MQVNFVRRSESGTSDCLLPALVGRRRGPARTNNIIIADHQEQTGSPLFTGLVPSARNGNLLYPLSQFQLHIAVSIHIHNGRKLPEEGAPRSHEYWRQQSLCRLQRSLASMGICQLRHLHLSRMLRRAQRIRCTHLLRKKYHHG